MRFQVASTLHYRVTQPTTLVVNVHVLRTPTQGVLDEHFAVEPWVKVEEMAAAAGENRFVRIETGKAKVEPADTLSNASEVHLLRPRPRPRRDSGRADPWHVPFPVVYDPLESAIAAVYRATTYADDTPAVLDFLRAQGLPGPDTSAGAEPHLDRLNALLYEQIAYNRRPEKGTQSPAITLETKAGSCRDIATLMMECCRALGIAARFASGYLDCPASTAGRASTHAWLEAYLPPHGWIGFDPTLGQRSSPKHIPTGLSNHPRGVIPVSGTFQGSTTGKFLSLDVAVRFTKLSYKTPAQEDANSS